ncbi:MAG: alpha-galactosidase [Chloroflexi bacterium]|nr:alpha-galactosidase [Chloroflexota bacterium]
MPIYAINNTWILETRHTGYAVSVSGSGRLVHGYWGRRLPYPEDYPAGEEGYGWASFNGVGQVTREEYPAYAGANYTEPCLRATFADGVRDVVLRFDRAEQPEAGTLHVHLRDVYYPLRVTLHYAVYDAYDIIERWVTVQNEGAQPLTLERVWSAQWHLPPGDDYRLTHLTGRWFDEMHLRRETLRQGVKLLDSRRLATGHHHNPFFALDRGSADEDNGEVWFGALGWSGNWQMAAEVTDFASTRMNVGVNDWDFAWRLEHGQDFSTPPAYAGYTIRGFGAASRRLHDFIREVVQPHDQPVHPVLYNSWEATMFNVDVASQIALAERAAQIGVELFVMDDGWFHGRGDDTAGLGDWWPDARKFPNGLKPLIARVNELGMKFGLWIEPEMVNPNSDLYRAHPDWVIHFPTRARTELRNQLMLNMARPDVRDYLIGHFDRLLSENNIEFIKWDTNRNVTEPGWPDAAAFGVREPRELWVRHVEGVYRVWDTLRDRHPRVIWQSCSGGGGRVDLGILRRADQVWPSDNTEASARLAIQEGFSYAYPANTMEAWVTDMNPNNLSLDFRFHVSMCGALGIGGHLLHWEEKGLLPGAAKWIALYKTLRHLVQYGDLYRLRSPQTQPFSALLYLAKDKSEGVLFVFRTHLPEPAILPPLYLRGLVSAARYEVEGFGVRSGEAWMRAGVKVELGNFESRVIRLRRL